MFRLRLFGGASIEGPAGPLTGRAVQRRRLALLALLGPARERGLTRDRLVGYLWPDADPDRARHLLSDSVYRINQALDGDALLAAGDLLRIHPETLSCDAWEFRDALEGGDPERAVQLYVAPFLEGFFVPDSGEFDRWATAEAERFRRERAEALEELARRAQDGGDESAAVRWWRTLAADDPHSSRVALELMRALERSGDRPAAVQYARIHATLVRDAMGVEPDPEVVALAESLRTPTRGGGRDPLGPGRPIAGQALTPGGATGPTTTGGGGAGDPVARGAADPATSESGAADPPRVEGGVASVGAREARDEPGSPRSSRGRRASRAVGAAAVLALALAALWMGTRPDADVPAGNEATPTSIAVLPFEDLSEAGDQEYFADGITEELLVRLSRVEGLDVVGRTSSFAFRGRDADVHEIASRLGVEVVLGGSVLKAGDRLRIFAQLIDASSGYQLWSERYERDEADVFAIQDEIALAIVTRLRGDLGNDPVTLPPGAPSPPEDPETYNLYLRGRFEWHRRSEEGLRNAAEYFRQATEREPGYARAFAGLGDAYAVLGFYDYLPPSEAFPQAAAAARRALELDPTLVGPHATLGYAALYHDWDWERSESEFRRTVELDPGYSTGRQWYANLLTAMGRFDEAVREMRAAQDLDPLSLIANAALGWVLYHAGEYEQAVSQLGSTLDLDPTFELAYLWRGLSYERLGRTAEAAADLERAVEMSGEGALALTALARTRAAAGDPSAARAILRRLEEREETGEYLPSYELATVHEALGEVPAGIARLERAYADRSHSMAFLMVDPRLASLREDPAFRDLTRRVGLDRRPDPP